MFTHSGGDLTRIHGKSYGTVSALLQGKKVTRT
jgi:hypothetical protein